VCPEQTADLEGGYSETELAEIEGEERITDDMKLKLGGLLSQPRCYSIHGSLLQSKDLATNGNQFYSKI
jgi:hypothetical protein